MSRAAATATAPAAPTQSWTAAHGLEVAESVGDEASIAQAALQAAIAAEREGHWLLAKRHADRARELFVTLGDVFGVGRCLQTLGALAFQLGRPEEARAKLRESFAILLDLGRDVEAADALSSLAQVQLRTGEYEDAERLARRALVFIGSRPDHRVDFGNAQLLLGRALLGQGRIDEAEETFADAEHRLAHGEAPGAATLYRRAAEALHDVQF